MGEIEFRGPEALACVQRLTSNNADKLKVGQIQYSALLYPEGTFVDDLLVYRLGEERFMLCVNAANTAQDFAYIQENSSGDAVIENISDRITQIAIQGPQAEAVLGQFTPLDLGGIRYYWFGRGTVAGVEDCIVSRTGYTGEDGFEVYIDGEGGPQVWEALYLAGQKVGLLPCGLGARDTLRFEAGMALYGQEIDRTTTPYEAGLGWIVKLKKGPFIGRDVLQQQKEEGIEEKLIGFEMLGRGIPRQGYLIRHQGQEIGRVTSGTMAPFLGKALGMGYVPVALAEPGTRIAIEIRDREVEAQLVPLPFYKREQ
jgi:aminomethyltransferase